MNRFKLAAVALLALFFLPAEASARFAGPQQIAAPAQHEKILLNFGGPKGFAFQKKHVFKKFGHHKPKFPKGPKGGSAHSGSNGQWGAYVAGAMICTVGWPMVNAALGNPEPTSQEMLQHTIGCFVPPLGVLFFLQQQGAL